MAHLEVETYKVRPTGKQYRLPEIQYRDNLNLNLVQRTTGKLLYTKTQVTSSNLLLVSLEY